MRTSCVLTIAAVIAFGAWAQSAEDVPWTPLFDGTTLDGWHEVLGGKWSVEDGCIVGETGDGRYGWLATNRRYFDFILELDFKTEAPGNSGVQFRSHVIKEGRKLDKDRMRGYQAEVSPKIGDSTGSVYGEATDRGWIAKLPSELETLLKEGEWNHYQISMIGDHCVLHLNGTKTVDFHDSAAIGGIIALQVHSGRTPVKVRWKNIRVKDLGYGPGWKPLFNGNDLTGWHQTGKEKWSVENGAIVGETVTKEYGYLATDASHRDFTVRLKYKSEQTGNSGLFFHSSFEPGGVLIQSEIAPDNPAVDGLIYGDGRGWISDPKKDAVPGLATAGEWNDMQVTCVGNRITTYVNGYRTVDFVDEKATHSDGAIALQLHSGGGGKMRFKDIYIK